MYWLCRTKPDRYSFSGIIDEHSYHPEVLFSRPFGCSKVNDPHVWLEKWRWFYPCQLPYRQASTQRCPNRLPLNSTPLGYPRHLTHLKFWKIRSAQKHQHRQRSGQRHDIGCLASRAGPSERSLFKEVPEWHQKMSKNHKKLTSRYKPPSSYFRTGGVWTSLDEGLLQRLAEGTQNIKTWNIKGVLHGGLQQPWKNTSNMFRVYVDSVGYRFFLKSKSVGSVGFAKPFDRTM